MPIKRRSARSVITCANWQRTSRRKSRRPVKWRVTLWKSTGERRNQCGGSNGAWVKYTLQHFWPLMMGAWIVLFLTGCSWLKKPEPQPPRVVYWTCGIPATLDPRPIPEKQGETYRDHLTHRVALMKFANQSEEDKANARAKLERCEQRANSAGQTDE